MSDVTRILSQIESAIRTPGQPRPIRNCRRRPEGLVCGSCVHSSYAIRHLERLWNCDGYDTLGRLITQDDPLWRRTELSYNARGLVESKTEPDPECGTNNPVTTYDYDDAGQLASVIDPLSRTTGYTRDKVGRVTRQTDPDPDGKGSLAAPYTDYAYNGLGTVPNSGNSYLTYDPAGNLLTLKDPVGNTTTFDSDCTEAHDFRLAS